MLARLFAIISTIICWAVIPVALIDQDEATLKYFKRLANKQIQLIPANSQYEAMIFEAEQIQIQGVVVGQLRTYD